MCGIAGIVDRRASTSATDLRAAISAMTERLARRGPDDSGVWVDAELGVAFGHRRLAVLDLTDAGHQPMRLDRAGGELVLTFNGEVYNHGDLRAELPRGETFRGSGDTETLLHAIRAWGLDRAIDRSVGMFAFGLIDTAERTLHLVRDRLGKKPLYVLDHGRWVAFASELAALAAIPRVRLALDPVSLPGYLATGAVPGAVSIYENVAKVLPGELVTYSLRDSAAPPRHRVYWRAFDHVPRGHGSVTDERELIDQLDDAIGSSVRERLRSDVPIGAFLSGGIDSSLVVAHAATATPDLRSFTISFPDADADEAPTAARTAQQLGTRHETFDVSSTDAVGLVGELPSLHDEPLADPSSIPTALLARHARSRVTVALSGDGGDEIAGGYPRHLRARRLSLLRKVPGIVRTPAGRLLAATADTLVARRPATAFRIDNLALAAAAPDLPNAALATGGRWKRPDRVLISPTRPRLAPLATSLTPPDDDLAELDPIDAFAVIDLLTFLPDMVLVKADRCTMAVGLELRSPLLDHRVVELALALPTTLKVRNRRQKWVLRELLARRLDSDVVDAPKSGFEPPLDGWLRGPLRSWGEHLLAAPELLGGHVDIDPVRKLWRDHQSGQSHGYRLWTVLTLLAWAEHWAPTT